MSSITKVVCFSCSAEIPVNGLVGRRDDCPKCRADLHCCKNCEFYDPKSYNECREPQADVVKEKDRSNYCDYFQPRQAGLGGKNSREALLAAAEALFKKK